MNLSAEQKRYREGIRNALWALRPSDGILATYASSKVTRKFDTENLLFYNVGASPFRHLAQKSLEFERSYSVPLPPVSLSFEAAHYVKYETRLGELDVSGMVALPILKSGAVQLAGPRELRKLAVLWWSFKPNIERTATEPWYSEDPFAVHLHVSAPASVVLNLADVVKPLIDGFISALHRYEGPQLDAVAVRISSLLDVSVDDVRNQLLSVENAVLGTKAVPHLYRKGLQWSPADHLLMAGKVYREETDDSVPVQITAAFYRSICAEKVSAPNPRFEEPTIGGGV
jgi:hypothetical protein